MIALVEIVIKKIKVLTAWKAVRSEATITGDEVLGKGCCESTAWKAVRLWRGKLLWRSASSLRFSAALGIARTSSALRSLARKFQAHRAVLVDPDTACPVTIASLCSAFQALSINLTNTPF